VVAVALAATLELEPASARSIGGSASLDHASGYGEAVALARRPAPGARRQRTMILGLSLAVASAMATNLAFLFKHRGAVLAPPVRVRQPLRSAAGLRSRWFLVGWIVAIVAWGLHVGALSLAPLSIVQAVLSGGLVCLAVFAERFFGFRLGDDSGSA
jgi:hypothetical protein